jgi:hypothetical protein
MVQNAGFNLRKMILVNKEWDEAVSAVNDDVNLCALGTPRRRCFDGLIIA